jgi:hypothetical protein
MPEDRQSVWEYVLANRKLLELGDLSDEETEIIRDATERLLSLIAHSDEE